MDDRSKSFQEVHFAINHVEVLYENIYKRENNFIERIY